jgi:choline dehydrogenase-like flavoprotein
LGRNLIFSSGGVGSGDLRYAGLADAEVLGLKSRGLFVNRALQDWYLFNDPQTGARIKGGTIEFLFRHSNGIAQADVQKRDADGNLIWGKPLKDRIKAYFTEGRHLRFEVFSDWTPVDDCHVRLDPEERDRWGLPVARVRLGYHPRDVELGRIIAPRAAEVLDRMGAVNVTWSVSPAPPQNLVAGGCRFGKDPATSVLNPDCRVHEVENLYVSDGSFMPTGGSVPYTWTIYANAFRVADRIVADLGGRGGDKGDAGDG